jgi:hypothetical protein
MGTGMHHKFIIDDLSSYNIGKLRNKSLGTTHIQIKRRNMTSDVRNDNKGAPASNAGDRFHELWALRKAMSLISPESQYQAMNLEGIPFTGAIANDGNWDAVDVCLLTGGETLSEATSAVFSQLKYSTTAPNTNWTVSRLCKSDAQTKNNSPLRKLAESFKAAEKIRKTENPNLQYKIQLVSNQPISDELLRLLGKIPTTSKAKATPKDGAKTEKNKKETLITASGLTKAQFAEFCTHLDFSECGSGLIWEQETKAILALETLINGNSDHTYLKLQRYISDEMMPERSTKPITETTILSRLGIASTDAIYPCPSRIKATNSAVQRQSVKDTAEKLVAGTQHILVHGGAGCGKTTTVGMLGQYLPTGSINIVYDCYGGGSYLDASNPRHRPQEAFTQLSNEIASQFGVPRLLRVSEEANAIKAFSQRLSQAASILQHSNPKAILMIVVDAADNAVSAAQRNGDQCFVHSFVTLQNLPSNVRIVVSARTARRDQLKLPPNFTQSEILPFSLQESQEFLKLNKVNQNEVWIRDFHQLTGGVPRILSYAIELPGGQVEAMSFLLPKGKNLSQIFELTVKNAWQQGGGDKESISAMCAALIVLPRPIPMDEIAYAIDLTPELTRDLCSDLSPMLRIDSQLVSFADEDFEDYVIASGKEKLSDIRIRIATRMRTKAETEPYAARHVVSLLIDAGMENEALQEAMKDPNDSLFPDPVVRRLCQLERMRSSLKLCSRTGNGNEALSILLIGIEGLRTSDAIADMLSKNSLLATRFSRAAVEKLILGDPNNFSSQGSALCHIMAEDARTGQTSRVEVSRRAFSAWQDNMREGHNNRDTSNQLTEDDVAAYYYAQLKISGNTSLDSALTKHEEHRSIIFNSIVNLLLADRALPLLTDLLSLSTLRVEERVHVISRLLRLGKAIEENTVESLIFSLSSTGLLNLSKAEDSTDSEALQNDAIELCEYLLRLVQPTNEFSLLLTKWAESSARRDSSQSHHRFPNSLLLRIKCLLAALGNKEIKAHELLNLESPPTADWIEKSQISKDEHSRQIKSHSYYSAVIPFYLSRAKFIITGNLDEFLGKRGSDWQQKLRAHVQYERRPELRGVAIDIVRAMASTTAISGDHTAVLFEHVRALLESKLYPFSAEDVCYILQPFTWKIPSHGPLTTYSNSWLETIATEKNSSSSKASSYLAFAKLLLTVSPKTSSSFYSKAFFVLEEIDYHEMYLLRIFDRLTSVVQATISDEEARSAAYALASFGSEAAAKLEGYDNFPWEKLSRAIARLNAPIGLALASQWEDEDQGIDTETLQVILSEGVKNGAIPATYAVAARYLSERTTEDLVQEIIAAAKKEDKKNQILVREMLAECEAQLRSSSPQLTRDDTILKMLPDAPLRSWTRYIKERAEFLRSLPAPPHDESPISYYSRDDSCERHEFLNNLSWDTYVFDSVKAISTFVNYAMTKGREKQPYFYLGAEIYQRIRSRVAANYQTEFLDYLAQSILEPESDFIFAEVLASSVTEWLGTSPIVRDWCSANIPHILSKNLTIFSIGMSGKPPIEKLIDSACVTNEKFYKALLSGVSAIENLDARLAYELIQTIARVMPPDEVKTSLNSYLARLLARTVPDYRLDIDDLPKEIPEAYARLLYANLGDTCLAVRWRAAHAVRSLFVLECADVIDQLLVRYARHDEVSFRTKGAPFYWSAARLWLIIAISHSCDDNPAFSAKYKDFLLSVLADEKYPHLLVRRFAQKGLERLSAFGAIKLTAPQSKKVRDTFKSPFRKQKRNQNPEYSDIGEDSRSNQRRFHFNTLDTIKYWYEPRVNLFADVTMAQFADEAERWIVDEWGIINAPWQWLDEPRRHKMERYHGHNYHSHGAIPSVERYSTHLEWHAMWCAVGSLLSTHPLNKGEWEEDPLEEDLLSSTVTCTPNVWLSDLRCPKPLEARFWAYPKLDFPWVREPTSNEALSILGLNKETEWLFINGSYSCYWKTYTERIEVSSCLVSADTSRALLRALQTSNDSHAHYLPTGEERSIDEPQFILESWLASTKGRDGLDSYDDVGEPLSSQASRPNITIVELCSLLPSPFFSAGWQVSTTDELAFYSEKWTEKIPEHRAYSAWDWTLSVGERLHCKRNILDMVLNHSQRNLLVKINTYRKQDEDQFQQRGEESQYFNTYLLLTYNGAIESIEGPIGTWKAVGSGNDSRQL